MDQASLSGPRDRLRDHWRGIWGASPRARVINPSTDGAQKAGIMLEMLTVILRELHVREKAQELVSYI